MYAYIKGTVAAVSEECVVLDNQGIGYRLFVPGSAMGEIAVGEERKFFTHFAVREDALQLYGFLMEDDLLLFRLLLGVGGVGPKGALGILSVMGADDLRFAILSEDAKSISKAPGVGLKTAQKVILELKDKMDLGEAFEKKSGHAAAQAAGGGADSAVSEAVMALSALGCASGEALKAVRKAAADLGDDADTETLIKAALKALY